MNCTWSYIDRNLLLCFTAIANSVMANGVATSSSVPGKQICASSPLDTVVLLKAVPLKKWSYWFMYLGPGPGITYNPTNQVSEANRLLANLLQIMAELLPGTGSTTRCLILSAWGSDHYLAKEHIPKIHWVHCNFLFGNTYWHKLINGLQCSQI